MRFIRWVQKFVYTFLFESGRRPLRDIIQQTIIRETLDIMQDATTISFRFRYGPWAVVAGASAGLGAEFATQLAAKGLHLVLIARRKELLDELSAKLRLDYAIEVRPLELDLAREDVGA